MWSTRDGEEARMWYWWIEEGLDKVRMLEVARCKHESLSGLIPANFILDDMIVRVLPDSTIAGPGLFHTLDLALALRSAGRFILP